MGLSEELDHAVVSFFVGDVNVVDALEAIVAALERTETRCVIVRDNGDVVVGARSRSLRQPLARVPVFANGNRLYVTAREDKLGVVFEDAPPAGAEWLVSEPIPDDPGRRAAIVVLGMGASADEVLLRLPRLAKACAAMLTRDRSDAMAWKLTHGLNNLLAGAIANAEYAASLVETIGTGAIPTAEERADIVHAIENTREGVKKMVATLKTLTAARRP